MKYWREATAVGKRIGIELVRRRRSLVLWAVFPVSILLLNGFILAEANRSTVGEAFSLAAPTTLTGTALFFSAVGGTVATLVAERESQSVVRLLLSPLSGVSYFLGILLAYGTVGLGQALLVGAIAGALGATYAGSWGLGLLVVALAEAGYVGLGFWLGAQFARRIEDVNGLVAGVGVPLLILSGSFFPVSILSEELLLLAQFNPIFHVNRAFLAIAVDGSGWEDGVLREDLYFSAGFVLAMWGAAWVSYRRLLRVERRL